MSEPRKTESDAMSKTLSVAEDEAIHYLYGGDDETPEYWSAQWVKIRCPQTCFSVYHGKKSATFPPGTRMLVERAKIEGQFRSCYTCAECMRKADAEIKERP